MRVLKYFAVSVFFFMIGMSLFGCGDGSSGSSGSPDTTAVAGSVFSALDGAGITVKDDSGAAVAGPVTTASDGTFSINVPNASLSSELTFESTGGTFTDEATGSSTTAGTLGAVVPAGSLSKGSSVNLDPTSTIIYYLVKTYGNTVTDAETTFNGAFGFTPDISVKPVNAPPSGTDTSGSLAGLHAITFSRLTKDLGLSPENRFDLLAALAEDLNDGAPDGMNGAAQVEIITGTDMPEDIQNMFERALTRLVSDTINHTELTADRIGALPFGKVALTDTYRIEYVPDMMAARQGKTTFKVGITYRSNGLSATGLAVSLMPMMYMASLNHSSPVETVIEDAVEPGTYNCTVYYLMASMMSGMSMGYWELKVMVGGMMGETATFYPLVGMAMGTDTVRATLKGQSDMINGMSGPEKRTYYLFNDGVGASSFELFIAAKESMMSFPAVSDGTELHDEFGAAWTVNPIVVSVSTDGSTWTTATDNTGGHWSVTGLTHTGTVYVMITVNAEQKTTDGNTPSGTGVNDYATFTVTP